MRMRITVSNICSIQNSHLNFIHTAPVLSAVDCIEYGCSYDSHIRVDIVERTEHLFRLLYLSNNVYNLQCKCPDQWSNNELNKMSLNLNMVEASAISTLYSPINTWDFPMSIDLSLPLSIDCHSIRYICDSLIEIYSVDIRIK